MGSSVNKFMRPIMAVVPPPRTDDVEAFIAVYAKVLDEFPDDVLEYAADTLLRTDKKLKSVPIPADCIDACRDAARALELRRQRAGRQKPKIPEQFMWTDDDAKHADKLFASEWGKRAVADGVEIGLWDFLVKQMRWPNGMEYDLLKARSKAIQEESRAFLRIQKENGGIKSDARVWLGSLKRQSDRLKQIALAG